MAEISKRVTIQMEPQLKVGDNRQSRVETGDCGRMD